MGELIELNSYPAINELPEKIRLGEITHAVIGYRNKDGEVKSIFVGSEDMTYLIGLAELIKNHAISLRMEDDYPFDC